ncbi:hypothetical protein C5B92_07080 [Rathayibacter sp. AY1A4]|uniref:hypothetical protein n=1 Tax=Rathayibacter sp. AY1A4 TaxID=2080522 RepID=UPI000CE8CF78|nr:hypothetical protein [Rathayibacter sp. AY1A4]PPF18271.1 hypothetical protein C5B92_07080 [Rathayibacter sp. AY1A4]
MGVITHSNVSSDEDLGRRVLAYARTIAPCLGTLDGETEQGKDAIALLKSIAKSVPDPEMSRVRSMNRNGTSMSFDVASAFSSDDRAALRYLCSGSAAAVGPIGSFPKGGHVAKVWPEGDY